MLMRAGLSTRTTRGAEARTIAALATAAGSATTGAATAELTGSAARALDPFQCNASTTSVPIANDTRMGTLVFTARA
jgi:hypothetical protein